MESATSLANKIRTRKLSSEEIVTSFINRIKEVNPIINAVVDERFDEALKEARKVDGFMRTTRESTAEIARNTPFLGVPFTIKDSFYVKGLRNTCGLYRWRNDVSGDDADVVKILRNAGAIPLALTNVPELCMWYESYNNVYGRTNNPYHTGCIPGGSSGGEGALQASCGCPFGIGSDIGGSIRMPAFFNGIFGHKPSPAIVSNNGQRPDPSKGLEPMLVVGPLCRYASDVLAVFKLIAEKGRHNLDLSFPVHLDSIRYFMMSDFGSAPLISPVHPDIKRCLTRVSDYLKDHYNLEVKKVKFDEMSLSYEVFDASLNVPDNPSFSEELTGRQGKLNVWSEVVKFLLRRSYHTLPALGFAIVEKLSPEIESLNHKKYISIRDTLRTKFEELLGNDGVLFFPTHPHAAPYHYQPAMMPFNVTYTAIFNALGLPSTHCPLGLNKAGLPIGIQVVAARNKDHLCLAVAAELERGLGGWVPPCKVLV